MSHLTIQERVKQVKRLASEVENHHMCLYFTETATHYQVQYPDGYFPQGIRVEKENSKANALKRLLPKMDTHWNDNYPS